MASTLLAAATAGVLLPIAAAANAQTDAQRRVIATRFCADVIERYVAGDALPETVTAAELGYFGAVYQPLSCTISAVPAGGVPGLTLVSAVVKYNHIPITELRTLVTAE